MMAKRSGRKTTTLASKTLRDPKASKRAKSLAGSVLVQDENPPAMTMEAAFDEWMRKYRDEPEGFSNAMQDVHSHDTQSAVPGVSEYGLMCASLLRALMARGMGAWDLPAKKKKRAKR